MRTLALCTGILLASTVANAAQFRYTLSEDQSYMFVYVTGDIEPDDDDKFFSYTRNIQYGRASIVLGSAGGNVVAGLNIGLRIKEMGWNTGVWTSLECASICGMIWLAGTTRYAGSGARIGFHAAYRVAEGWLGWFGRCLMRCDPQISSGGNALVGAYLRDLGLGFNAIRYLTETPPDQIEWLTPEKARKYGIAMHILQ
jgi:hypothetical protein